MNRKCFRCADLETQQLLIETGWVRGRTELDVDVVMRIELPGCVLALQIHGDGIALNDAAAFDRLGPRRAFAQPLECLFGRRVIHRDRRPSQRERGVVAGLEWRKCVEGSGEGQRLTLLNGDIANFRSVYRLDPLFAQSLVHGRRNQVVDHLMKDLLLEPLLDDAGRGLARPEAGNSRPARVVSCVTLDLGVDHVARDFDTDVLARVVDVDELCFHVRD
jgi:hypothetical protein